MMLINFFERDPETDYYKAACNIDGKRKVLTIWEQGNTLYVNTGSATRGDLTRHDFSFKQDAVFRAFVKSGEYLGAFCAEGF